MAWMLPVLPDAVRSLMWVPPSVLSYSLLMPRKKFSGDVGEPVSGLTAMG